MLPKPSLDLIFSRSVRFSVFNFRWPDTRSSSSSQLFHAERLGHVVVSPILHGLHGGLHGAVSGDHHDDRIGLAFADLMQRLQPARARQLQVEQHDIDVLGLKQTISMLGGIRH